MSVISLLFYSSSDHYSLENMAHSVIEGSRVAEICSYKTHTSTVIHTVRLAMCRDSAAQDESPLPLTVLTSCYLCPSSLITKFRKRFHTLTGFSLLPTTSFIGLIRIRAFDILQIPCGCSQICSGCSAATCIPVARALLYLCTCSRDGLLATQYEKPAEHDPHLHTRMIAETVKESCVSHTVISL